MEAGRQVDTHGPVLQDAIKVRVCIDEGSVSRGLQGPVPPPPPPTTQPPLPSPSCLPYLCTKLSTFKAVQLGVHLLPKTARKPGH